ncbi:MAG TPA: GAF domain-containing sensor histidine kinase [Frankiaceae bacterium]|nr:GAF domain-containing sensor histidine kinase [Frankiaceae bacterium]
MSDDQPVGLAEEQLSLRRVATLVARGVPPEELFAAVTEEVAAVLSVEYAVLGRYESDGAITLLAIAGSGGQRITSGGRRILEGENVNTLVLETARPARVENYADASGPLARLAPDDRIESGVGAPVVVDGGLWGVVGVYTAAGQPIPADAEGRLTNFTELLATAISNAQSRAELARLADEQAALRRVATLVAGGAPPEAVFESVLDELGRLLHVDLASICRYDDDGSITWVANWGRARKHFPIGSRRPLGGRNLGTIVFETGRSARIDSYLDVCSGPIGAVAREARINSSLAAPITVEGRLWGVIAAGSVLNQPMPADTEARLASFTELVATAIANAESHAELTASRARIVAAADDARRRIERDLHDGAQQQLVTLGLKLRASALTIPPGMEGLHADVGEIASGLDDVLNALRELSRGIHPAVLSTGGLAPALRTLARRSPIPVEVDVRLPTRPPERIEVAIYYLVAEALTNAAKHGQASAVVVEVQARNGGIRVAVSDDGVGGADPSRGSGLLGLHDRAGAHGATMTLTSPPGQGTSISVHFPGIVI